MATTLECDCGLTGIIILLPWWNILDIGYTGQSNSCPNSRCITIVNWVQPLELNTKLCTLCKFFACYQYHLINKQLDVRQTEKQLDMKTLIIFMISVNHYQKWFTVHINVQHFILSSSVLTRWNGHFTAEDSLRLPWNQILWVKTLCFLWNSRWAKATGPSGNGRKCAGHGDHFVGAFSRRETWWQVALHGDEERLQQANLEHGGRSHLQ